MITVVTITGADESVKPGDLFQLSMKYPFVEWAILVSRNSTGQKSRFPKMDWIKSLIDVAAVTKHSQAPMKLSLHLCGDYVNELLNGEVGFIYSELAEIWLAFQRFQINTHGIAHEYDGKGLIETLKLWPEKEFIFQYDEVNDGALKACVNAGVNCSALFDLSHGAGIAPDKWPQPIDGIKCGYAGGISPENIVKNIMAVNSVSRGRETWIDMETHVRSNQDKQFDLYRVEDCLRKYTEFKTHRFEP